MKVKRSINRVLLFGVVILFTSKGLLAQAGPGHKPKTPSCPATPTRIGDVKELLACAWLTDPQDVLEALKFYTTPIRTSLSRKSSECAETPETEESVKFLSPVESTHCALLSLVKADPAHAGFYSEAQGQPGKSGVPTAQGVSALLEMLAEANTFNDEKPTRKQRDDALDNADCMIQELFKTDPGRRALALANASFNEQENHLALYELLSAVPDSPLCGIATANKSIYAANLEIFRAAFEADTPALAALVARTQS